MCISSHGSQGAGAIYWASIKRVVYGCPGKVLGEICGEALSIPCEEIFLSGRLHSVETIKGVLSDEAAEIHTKYWTNWKGNHY